MTYNTDDGENLTPNNRFVREGTAGNPFTEAYSARLARIEQALLDHDQARCDELGNSEEAYSGVHELLEILKRLNFLFAAAGLDMPPSVLRRDRRMRQRLRRRRSRVSRSNDIEMWSPEFAEFIKCLRITACAVDSRFNAYVMHLARAARTLGEALSVEWGHLEI